MTMRALRVWRDNVWHVRAQEKLPGIVILRGQQMVVLIVLTAQETGARHAVVRLQLRLVPVTPLQLQAVPPGGPRPESRTLAERGRTDLLTP